MRARLAMRGGRVEKGVKVKKAERVERVRMRRVQQGSTAIRVRRLENRSASGTKVLWLKLNSEEKFDKNPPPS